MNTLQTAQDKGYRRTVLLPHLTLADEAVLIAWTQQNGHHGIALQADFVDHDKCRLQTAENGVQSEDVAMHLLLLDGAHQVGTNLFLVACHQVTLKQLFQPCIQGKSLFFLSGSKNELICHNSTIFMQSYKFLRKNVSFQEKVRIFAEKIDENL